MGEATDRKLTEMEDTRRRLEADIRELEARIPAPLRSARSVIGAIVGVTALAALIRRRSGTKRSERHPSAEVVIRIVRDDE